nr:hypothetical protein [Rubripirellula reticaptiva]
MTTIFAQQTVVIATPKEHSAVHGLHKITDIPSILEINIASGQWALIC